MWSFGTVLWLKLVVALLMAILLVQRATQLFKKNRQGFWFVVVAFIGILSLAVAGAVVRARVLNR